MIHAPSPDLCDNLGAGRIRHALAAAGGKRLLFRCAFGERSAMAVAAAEAAGLAALNIHEGMAAWTEAGGPLED